MTLPLTPEQTRIVVEALQRDGHAWVDVECVCVPYWPKGHPEHFCSCVGRWVEAAAAVCQRCGGDLAERLQARDWGAVQVVQNCPDCHNGKPIHTLTVDCEECKRQSNHRLHDLMGHWTGAGIKCPGTVTVRYVVAEPLLQVVAGACPDKTNAPHRRAHVHVSSGVWCRYGYHPENDDLVWGSPWKPENRITPIGDPQPGDWVAHLEAVT